MERQEENSYRNILKRISAFGGVQMFNVVIGLVRGKFVALFLGADGMGISTLYNSSTATIQQICSLGLNLAVVKEVAASKDDPRRLRHTLRVGLRLLLLTCLLGALVCGAMAPLWSRWTFGDGRETVSYLWLSLFVALSIAGAGYLALLQGLGEVKRLSKASLVGGLAGLLFGVPLYYLFGTAGIVPAMIILALSTFLFYYFNFKAAERGEAVRGDAAAEEEAETATAAPDTRGLVGRLVSLGFILLIGALAGTLTNYLINMFIRYAGSVEDVGLFQAANSITNQYVGMVFSALALDYFPRLSAICHDSEKMHEVVNRQTEIVILVAAPLIIALILTAPLLIRLLLTQQFMVVIPLINWLGFGTLIQAIAFPLGYIYVAREDRKVFLWLECVWGNVCWLLCSVVFYYWQGLDGLGMSLVARGVIDLIINYMLCKRRYGFRYSGRAWKSVGVALVLTGGAFGVATCGGGRLMIAAEAAILAASAGYSFFVLRRRLR